MVACMLLHNYCMERRIKLDDAELLPTDEDDEEAVNNPAGIVNVLGQQVQQELINTFAR